MFTRHNILFVIDACIYIDDDPCLLIIQDSYPSSNPDVFYSVFYGTRCLCKGATLVAASQSGWGGIDRVMYIIPQVACK